MRFTTLQMAAATSGTVNGVDSQVDGATIDSRRVAPGQLFVAISGERDGHDFVGAARASGATVALVERAVDELSSVVVDDCAAALATLGAEARRCLEGARIVGVTGSVGKTSTKDLLAAVLARGYVTAASERSHNNELGVPLTLLNAPDDAGAVVVEMGARGRGHIADLCALARPQVGVVTAVAAAHTELFGGVEAVAEAKAELVEALPADGLAVLNAADPQVAAMAERTAARVLRFGADGDVRASLVVLDDELRPAFRLESPWGAAEVRLAARGEHNVANALAAAAVALHEGVPIAEVAEALAGATLSPWRMELIRLPGGATLLNDAYNANPTSMEAALRSLLALPAGRRVAVLGAMAELGEESDDHHVRIAALASSLGIEVVAFGTEQYGVRAVSELTEAAEALGELGPGVAVLVKGSRVAGLERLAELLVS